MPRLSPHVPYLKHSGQHPANVLGVVIFCLVSSQRVKVLIIDTRQGIPFHINVNSVFYVSIDRMQITHI